MSTLQHAGLTTAGATLGALRAGPGQRHRGAISGGGAGLAFSAAYNPAARMGEKYLTNVAGMSPEVARLVGGLTGGTLASALTSKTLNAILQKRRTKPPRYDNYSQYAESFYRGIPYGR